MDYAVDSLQISAKAAAGPWGSGEAEGWPFPRPSSAALRPSGVRLAGEADHHHGWRAEIRGRWFRRFVPLFAGLSQLGYGLLRSPRCFGDGVLAGRQALAQRPEFGLRGLRRSGVPGRGL